MAFSLLNKLRVGAGRVGSGHRKGGMYLSVLLRPTVQKKYWFALSFAASLAALDTLRHQLARHFDNKNMPQIGLKWPNDVIMSGGKIAGILLEAEGQTLIVGSGINIEPVQTLVRQGNNHESQTIRQLNRRRWPIFGRKRRGFANTIPTARYFMARLVYWNRKFDENGFAPIRDAWLSNALFFGKALSVGMERREFQSLS